MFKIENDVIYLTRGDKATIELSIDDYTFQVNDKIELRVYAKSALDKAPVLEKEVTVNESGETVDIALTSEDTSIGTMQNKPVEYWYEIELNNEQTIIGYDENGAKKLILYPEGAEDNDNE